MGGVVAGAILLISLISPLTGHEKASSKPDVLSANTSSIASAKVKENPTPTPKNQTTIYIVEEGDSFDSISEDIYGSGKYWTTLWNDNDWIENPKNIRAGMELKIRADKPGKAEDLNEELAKLYEELSATPTPTPTPSEAPQPTTVVNAPPSSFDEAYRQAGSRFGVPWEILYGLHHMETGGRDGAISSGYGTGAQGPLQFMPGTWAIYGIDGNADGNVDINNAVDAIFGAANFIAAHGGVESGLRAYGGDTNLVYSYARSRGWTQ